jgi:hypothetical protein
MHGVAREFSDALNREVTYCDISPEDWERELKRVELPEHLAAGGRRGAGHRPAITVQEFVSLYPDHFGG